MFVLFQLILQGIIPFTLLIKNAHDSYPSYFFPNEMNLGIAEAFTPFFFILKFQMEVKEKYSLIIKEEE